MVFAIYAKFADFSAISKDHNNPGSIVKFEEAQKAAQARIAAEAPQQDEMKKAENAATEAQDKLKDATNEKAK